MSKNASPDDSESSLAAQLQQAQLLKELALLDEYSRLKSPTAWIIGIGVAIAVLTISIYAVIGFWLPANLEQSYKWLWVIWNDPDDFRQFIDTRLDVSPKTRWQRVTLLYYLSLYFGMWWAYFLSKRAADEEEDKKHQ